MTPANFALIGASTVAFLAAASAAKAWALSQNSWLWLGLTLILYTLGNLIMLRLIREVGMGIALSQPEQRVANCEALPGARRLAQEQVTS